MPYQNNMNQTLEEVFFCPAQTKCKEVLTFNDFCLSNVTCCFQAVFSTSDDFTFQVLTAKVFEWLICFAVKSVPRT